MMNTLLPVNQLFDAAFGSRDHAGSPNRDQVFKRVPRANILEGDKDYQIRMDLPGVKTENLDINLEEQVLTVKAERSFELPEGYQTRRQELPGKVSFARSFDLGTAVDADKIGAKLEDGLLLITLPKSEQSLPRRIEIQ